MIINKNNIVKFLIFGYLICMSILIYLYIYKKHHRKTILNIISILSGSALTLTLFNIISTENQKTLNEIDKKKRDHVDYIRTSFDKIN